MKKYLMILLLASLLLCTGCGKKLECSMNDDGGMEWYITTEFDSKGKATKTKSIVKMDMKELYGMTEAETKEIAKEYANDEEYTAKDAKITSEGTVITIEYSEDEEDHKSYDELKKFLEEERWECK